MALHINDNVREEWDNIDFEDDTSNYRQQKATIRSKNTTVSGNTAAKSKNNENEWTSPRRKVRQTPAQDRVYENSKFGQEHTGETQDCITIEPRPSIVPRDSLKSVVERQPQYRPGNLSTKRSVNYGRSKVVKGPKNEDNSSETSFGWLDEGSPKDVDSGIAGQKSDSASDRDSEVGSQEASSSIGETEDSLSEDEGSELDPSNAEVANTINLPYDSDDEEMKAEEEKRVHDYKRVNQLTSTQNLENKEGYSTQTSKHAKESPSRTATAVSSCMLTASSVSQNSLKPVPGQSQLSSEHGVKQYSSPIKGNLIHIPVSSSTEVSQNVHSTEPSDIQLQQTPLNLKTSRDMDSKVKTPLDLGTNPVIPLPIFAKTQSPFKPLLSSPMVQRDSPGIALQRSAAAFSSPIRLSVSTHKHQRSSRESSAEIGTTIRKRRRLESPIDLSSTSRNVTRMSSPASAITPPPTSHRKQIAVTSILGISPGKSSRVVEHPSGSVDKTSPVSRHSGQTTKNDAAKSTPHVLQRAPHVLEGIDFDHDLPRISASQPIPDRRRIRTAHQVGASKPSPQTHTPLPGPAQSSVVRHEVSESPEPSSSEAVELELEPLTKILNLQGDSYCEAVRNDRVMGSLQRLYCEFLAKHLTYLGDMNHLFNLCAWLLRSRADPDEEGSVDEDSWDDFILQHQQGKYDTYVRRSLAKFRQPGSWSTWYHQAERSKLERNVITAQRLEQILLGKESKAEKQRIPFLWSRFKYAKPTSVS